MEQRFCNDKRCSPQWRYKHFILYHKWLCQPPTLSLSMTAHHSWVKNLNSFLRPTAPYIPLQPQPPRLLSISATLASLALCFSTAVLCRKYFHSFKWSASSSFIQISATMTFPHWHLPKNQEKVSLIKLSFKAPVLFPHSILSHLKYLYFHLININLHWTATSTMDIFCFIRA